MPDQGDWTHVEPAIPEGTNSDLVSPRGMPYHSDIGSGSGQAGQKSRAAGLVDRGKEKLASKLHGLGDRIEHTGLELESGGMLARPVGRVLDRTGNTIEGGGNYLRTHDIDVIGDDFVAGIRNRPLMSAGIAMGVGWLLGRMIGGSGSEDGRPASPGEGDHEKEHVEEDVDRSAGPSVREKVKGRMTELVASGLAAVAARQIRHRIAGR